MSLKLGTTDISGVPTTLINTVNNKLDASTYTSNPRTNAVYIKTSYVSGTSGYNIWSNGYCEQWGCVVGVSYKGSTGYTLMLAKTFANTDYNVLLTLAGRQYSTTGWGAEVNSNNSFTVFNNQTSSIVRNFFWKACGNLASGQY